MMRRQWLLWSVLAIALAAPPGRAENPRVSLKLDNATLAEAAAKLGEAARVSIEVPRIGNDPDPTEKTSFDWTNVRLGTALRQLCARFDLRPVSNQPGGYVLYPNRGFGPGGGAPVPGPLRQVERNGARIFVRGIQMNESRSIQFMEGQPNWSHASLNLTLGCQISDGDGDAIAGVENVTARDDLGNVLIADAGRSSGGGGTATYPDEWVGSVGLGYPHPKARKLTWIEGDLLVYRKVRPLQCEIPLPINGKRVRKEFQDLTFLVSDYQVTAKPAPEDDLDADLPRFENNSGQYGPTMRIRVFSPVNSAVASRSGNQWSMPPYLVGASGKAYRGNPVGGSSGFGDGRLVVSDATYTFRTDEPPAKLVWDLVERSQPERLLTFRMTDVPLPPGQEVIARRATPPPPLPPRPAPGSERPFYEKGGGTLVSQVLIQDRPALEGVLSVGLSPKQGTEWGGVRWLELDLNGQSQARLGDVKPGSYRLLRIFRPRDGKGPGLGRWENGELTIEVAAGKEVTAPALRWTPEPDDGAAAPPRPGPAQRPPARKPPKK